MKTTPRVEFVNRKFKIAVSGYPCAEFTHTHTHTHTHTTKKFKKREREAHTQIKCQKRKILKNGSQLVWLSGLTPGLQTKVLLLRFLIRAHAWVVGLVPSRGFWRSNHALVSFPLFLPHVPSL